MLGKEKARSFVLFPNFLYLSINCFFLNMSPHNWAKKNVTPLTDIT